MSIDHKKRTTLKTLAVATGAVAAPSLVYGACQSAASSTAALETTPLSGTGLVISMSERCNLSPINGSRTVVITNTSDAAVSLRHVYPGIISTHNAKFDINTLLAKGPRVFQAKQSYSFNLNALTADAEEKQLPMHMNKMAQVHVSTTSSAVNEGKAVNTVRTLIS